METLTIPELLDKLDDIIEQYDNGDNTHYRILNGDNACILTPYDGPWTETVKKDNDGELYVEIPKRLLNRLGITLETELNMEVVGDNIQITKKELS